MKREFKVKRNNFRKFPNAKKKERNISIMGNSDTIHLLKECDAGSKMAVSAIDDVLDSVTDGRLKELLEESKKHHEKYGNDLHEMLNQKGSEEKDPSMIAKGMSWIKTNVKIGMDSSDATIAELIVDGCDMGIKSLYQYLNQYSEAEAIAKKLCEKLISIEDELRKKLYAYL